MTDTTTQTGDSSIEQRLQDAKCTAPRLSPKDIEANIKHVEYVKHISHGGQVLRWAVITTLNGFAVTGRPSASVSPENDRQDIGESVALENAKSELWPLMGYALKEKLHAEATKQAVTEQRAAYFDASVTVKPHEQIGGAA